MNPLYPNTAARAEMRCEYCRAPQRAFNWRFEVEHIVPRKMDGTDDADNLALACHVCNRLKSMRQTGIDPLTQQAVALFHPRRQDWSEHFQFAPDGLTIEGKTPTGRATIRTLEMNAPAQQTARGFWILANLFP